MFHLQNHCRIFIFIFIFLAVIVAFIPVSGNIPLPDVIGIEMKDMTNALTFNPIIKGIISEVYNNNTVQLNGTLNVKLSFIKHSYNDTLKQEDSTHYASVMCPIKSPALVYVESQINNQSTHSVILNESTSYISGILFCQTTSVSDTLKELSINEDLISSKVAVLDSSSCKNFEKLIDRLKSAFGC